MSPAMPHTSAAATKSDMWRGVYDAHRAAALSGVPERTLARWASTGLYLPSISPDPRTRFWSWFDLVALRTIDWLRKPQDDLVRVPIVKIRRALEDLETRGLSPAELHDLVLRSDSGDLFMESGSDLVRADPSRQA